jgi:hypothetical protein
MGIPLPENYRLGLEERAGLVNHSEKNKNNFGMNRNALFPGGAGGKYDTRNWISTFTKSGCVVCREDNGRSNHKGRDGKPGVLVIGDEAVPTVVGYTSGDGEGTGCAWVFKKEHLALSEVSGILKRINDDKRESDKMSGKREHDFFIPSGSKILVGSYVHLRREGLEGYVTDFNNMVREVKNITGDIGIEVLPVVPVCFEGLDKVGRDLLGGLRMWINWIGEKGGRVEIKELSNTAGRERGGDEVTFLWKPSFLLLQSCQGGRTEIGGRGNTLVMVGGEREEWKVKGATPAREIKRMMGWNGGVDETDEMETEGREEQMARETFDKGISVEAELAFAKAVGCFSRESAREGRFRGSYRFNLKEQMEQKAKLATQGQQTMVNRDPVRLLLIGGSQMGRIGAEISKVQKENGRVRVEDHIKTFGMIKVNEITSALRELKSGGKEFESVILSGPGNCLVEHGVGDGRGFNLERKVRVMTDRRKGTQELDISYHMTDPRKIAMCERRKVVDSVTKVWTEVRKTFPDAEVTYLTMFPRFVVECCDTHMTKDDVVVIDGIRRDVDKDIVDGIREQDRTASILQWWEVIGLNKDMTADETRDMRVVDTDGVHLTPKANGNAALFICKRLSELERTRVESGSIGGGVVKRARW